MATRKNSARPASGKAPDQVTLPRERSFEHRRVQHDFARPGARQLQLSARRVMANAGMGKLVLVVVESITGTEAGT